MDIVPPHIRSRMMASIRGANTGPERLVRSLLHAAGFRFRLHLSGLPGRPDIVLPKHNLAVFVHGCFWHRHAGCRFAYRPESNAAFWNAKLNANRFRDRRNLRALRKLGWRTLVVWECHIRNAKDLEHFSQQLAQIIQSDVGEAELPQRRA